MPGPGISLYLFYFWFRPLNEDWINIITDYPSIAFDLISYRPGPGIFTDILVFSCLSVLPIVCPFYFLPDYGL